MHPSTPIVALLPLLTGCLSLPDSELRPVRFYDLLLPAPAEPRASSVEDPAPARLRLRRVASAEALGTRMVSRRGEHELAYSEDRRWAEPPAGFVERALARELVDGRGFQLVEQPAAPVLDFTLRAFEEVSGSEPRFRIVLDLRCLDATGMPLADRSLEASSAVEGGDPGAVAGAAGRALEAIVSQAADLVQSVLRRT